MKKGCTDHHNYISHLEKELHRTKELARELLNEIKKFHDSVCFHKREDLIEGKWCKLIPRAEKILGEK